MRHKTKDTQHSILSASSAARWMNCPGSVALVKKINPARKTSIYAAEGTAAHQLGDLCLRKNKNADNYWGDTILVEDQTFVVNDDMVDAVQVYLDTVRDAAPIRKRATGAVRMQTEKKVRLDFISRGMFGTADANVLNYRKRLLTVFDYKHGRGVLVDPENNPQLMYYALGTLYKSVHLIATVDIVVVQPRAEAGIPVKRWRIKAIELLAWGATILRPCALRAKDPTSPLNPGPWCSNTFCPVLAQCPAVRKHVMAVAKTDFSNDMLSFTTPDQLDVLSMINILDAAPLITAYLKSVQTYAHHEAEQGRIPSGRKLVKKRSNRQWADVQDAEAVLRDLLGDDAYEQKIRSVAQAEKRLKKLKIDVKLALDGMIVKPDTGTSLVLDSDTRPAVAESPTKILTDFSEELEED